jgi:ABC-type uncharacterized transport system involved in gliding motility auxiliary subunit
MSTTKKTHPTRLLAIAVVLAIILFLALNLLVNMNARSVRADVTESGLYTLSEGTRTVLSDLQEPVHLRFFMTSGMVNKAPQLAAFANRVKEILDSYTSMSKGMLTMEVIDPQRYSDEEDRAVGLGITPLAVAGDNQQIFFGLAGTNSTDGKSAIPVFSPDREPELEYDLTRMIAELGQPGKPKIVIFDGIGVAGNPSVRMPPQQIYVQLAQFFEIQLMFGDVDEMPKNTRIALIAHPQNLTDRTLFTIDQWIVGGGAAMIFVDPFAETQTGMRPNQPARNPTSTMQPFFDAWGIKYDMTKAVGDPAIALRTVRNVGGRQQQVANYPWLGLRKELFSPQDPVMANLQSIFMTTAGSFDVIDGKGVTLKPLIIASPEAGRIDAKNAGNPQGDPRKMIAEFKKAEDTLILGARLGGKLKSAYPNGKPEGSEFKGEPATESTAEPSVMLFSDVDMLMDRNWIQQRQVLGQRVSQPFANNGDLVLNAAEQLAGGAVLAGLRGRGVSWRPFERIQALEAKAESQYLTKEQELMARLKETEAKMRELSQSDAPKGELFSAESTEAVTKFRSTILATRAQLREVQFNLRSDVDKLKTWLTALNVGFVPAVIAIVAFMFAMRRSRRKVPAAPSAAAPTSR